MTFRGTVQEDATFSALARLCSLDGTGDTVADREGPCLTQADVASIACKVYDLGTDETSTTGTEVSPAPGSEVSDCIYDALQLAGWGEDSAGYNFRHDVGPAYTADPGEYRLVEYTFALTSGATLIIKYLVFVQPTRSS